MGLREEKKAAMRAAIIETALALFRTLGFNRARVQDVIRQLQISEATFFNYFPTKQAVLDAAAQDLIDRSLEVLRAELEDDERSVGERIDLVAQHFASSFNGDRELAVLVATHTRMSLTAGDDDSEGRQLLTRLFASGQERGEVRSDVPARRLTDHYLAFSFTALTRWTANGDEDASLEEQLMTGLTLFWSGAEAKPAIARRRRPATKRRERQRGG
jgi:AcrR family transcriptional regulator